MCSYEKCSSKTHVPPGLHFGDSRQLCSLVLFIPRCISLSLRGRKSHFQPFSSASCKLNPNLKAIATNPLSPGISCHFAHQSFELYRSIFHGCTRWKRNLRDALVRSSRWGFARCCWFQNYQKFKNGEGPQVLQPEDEAEGAIESKRS